MKKIIFTGGGTGGHIMPNIALIEKLKTKHICKYIGSANSMEEKLIKPNVDFFAITTCKLKRSLSLSNLLIPFKLIKGICEAKKILKQEKPDLVFSKGGYVSLPVVMACKSLKIPVVAHESDLSMGLANKLACRYTKLVCTTFPETAKTIKNGVWTGSPIRDEIFKGNASTVFKKHNLNKNLATLLIVGGSLGSKNLNELVYKNAKELTNKYNILHITGKNSNLKTNIPNYHILTSTDKIEDYFMASDVVITRGGSNVLFELLALKKPMLIIPLEKGSRGDQIENAKWFESKGYAKMLSESEVLQNNKLLFEELTNMQKNKYKYIQNMQNSDYVGTKKIIDLIEENLKSNG